MDVLSDGSWERCLIWSLRLYLIFKVTMDRPQQDIYATSNLFSGKSLVRCGLIAGEFTGMLHTIWWSCNDEATFAALVKPCFFCGTACWQWVFEKIVHSIARLIQDVMFSDMFQSTFHVKDKPTKLLIPIEDSCRTDSCCADCHRITYWNSVSVHCSKHLSSSGSSKVLEAITA
jgi:hypothetical protein